MLPYVGRSKSGIDPAQSPAARALLEWSTRNAGLIPPGSGYPLCAILRRGEHRSQPIRLALESAGVKFIDAVKRPAGGEVEAATHQGGRVIAETISIQTLGDLP
jgi:hypothetical protein